MFSVNFRSASARASSLLAAVPAVLLGFVPGSARSQAPDSSQFGFIDRSTRVPIRQRSQPAPPPPPPPPPSRLPHPAPSLTGTPAEGSATRPPNGTSQASTAPVPVSAHQLQPGILAEALPPWLRLELGLQSLYDSNIFLQSRNESADWVNRVTPLIAAFVGDPAETDWYGEARYTPAWTTYATNADINRFDQGGALEGAWQQPLLALRGVLSYQENTANDRFTSDLFTTTSTRAYTAANYILGPSTFLEGSMEWVRTDRGESLQGSRTNFNDQDSFDARVAALWQISPSTRLGPAVRYQRITSSINTDRDMLHGLLAISYNPESIFSLRGDLGAQWVSLDSGTSNWAPSATLSGLWDVDALWKVGMSIYSQSLASPTGTDSSQQSTGISGTVSWIPDELLLVTAGLGYEASKFEVYSGTNPGREDDYLFGDLSLRITPPQSALGLAFFYRYRFTDSSLESQDFSNSQAGLQLNYRF
jgi:hypothetical protein